MFYMSRCYTLHVMSNDLSFHLLAFLFTEDSAFDRRGKQKSDRH